MVTVSRLVFLPFLAPILGPAGCPTLTSHLDLIGETRPTAISHAGRGIRNRPPRFGDRTANGRRLCITLQ
jgi:hypothetical protein